MLMLTGQRTSIFGLILGVLILFLSGARTPRAALGRLALALVPVLFVAVLAKAPTTDDVLSHTGDEKVQTVLSHTASGTLRPTQEDSLLERLETWGYLATTVIPSQPLGAGLGATSLGVKRFDHSGVAAKPIDSYFISVAVACSVPAALLFIWILVRATSISWRSYRNASPGSAEARTWRVVVALMPMLILNSVFGNNFTLYSVAPLGWLLVGWISAQKLRQNTEAGTAAQT
jgi:hypothetical protein